MEVKFAKGSDVAAFYLKHEEAMTACNDCPEGESFGLQAADYDLAILKDLASALSVGKKCFVVIAWPGVYEVQRLPDGINRQLLLKHLKMPDKQSQAVNGPSTYAAFLKMVKKCFSEGFENVKKFDSYLAINEYQNFELTYAVLQRRLAGVAAFRKHENGSTAAIKECILMAIENGICFDSSEGKKTKFRFKLDF